MGFDTVFFDLDGTLTDSGPGIRNSVAYAMERFGIAVPDEAALNRFVGPPLVESFQRFCGLDGAQARQGVAFYREYFCGRGMFENRVYDGIPELLSGLKRAGKKLVLATSKPELFSVQILEHFGLSRWFDCVAGAAMDETRTKKSEVLAYALQKAGVTDLSSAVMAGDRENDVLGAHAVGLPCIGVLYGYGSRGELEAAGAEYLAENPGELARLICGEENHA